MSNDQQTWSARTVIKGTGIGALAALIYSLTPMFVFFFNVNGSNDPNAKAMTIIYAVFLAWLQEFFSFIVITGFNGYDGLCQKEFIKHRKWLQICLRFGIISYPFLFGYGLRISFRLIFEHLHYKEGWIAAAVGLFAGPISMGLLMVCSQLLSGNATLPTLILYISSVVVAILARIFLKEGLTWLGYGSLIVACILLAALVAIYIVEGKLTTPIMIAGVVLSFLPMIFYSLEAFVSTAILHYSKVNFSFQALLCIKTSLSTILMFVVILPITSVAVGMPGWQGWEAFVVFSPKTGPNDIYHFGGLSALLLVSSVLYGFGRYCLFKTFAVLNGTYGNALLLMQLIITPIIQLIGHAVLPSFTFDPIPYYYWIFICFILVALALLMVNQSLTAWFTQRMARHKLFKKEQAQRKRE